MSNENTKFINSLFLKNLIEDHYGKKEVKIKTYTVEPPSEYGSALTRASINRVFVKYSAQGVSEDVITFVTKVKPTKGELADEFRLSGDFTKEVLVYKDIVPAFERALKRVAEKIDFTPNIVSIFSSPTDGIIFEEVTNRGYHIQFEKTGLNFEQSALALRKLAQFHACSTVLMEENSIDLERFAKGTFHQDWKSKMEYFNEAYRLIVDNANGLGIDSAIQQKLRDFSPRALPKVIEDYTSSVKGFRVLNHGDFFTKNIFFKYRGNDLVDALFVDFQNAVIGTPLIDLFYFLTASVAYSTLAESRDELIYVYHESLLKTLELFEYKGPTPTLNELHIEILKRSSLEMFFAITLAPYLRTPEPRVVTAVQPSLYKPEYLQQLKSHGKSVLEQNGEFIRAQLKKFDVLGTLDYTGDEGRIRGIMNRFASARI